MGNNGNFKDISGQRFGRLVAIKTVGSNRAGQKIWECRCDCGAIEHCIWQQSSIREKH